MDMLDEVAGVTPINLDDFIEEKPLAPIAPEASIRNRAAFTALQSDKPIENYQALYQEGMEGRSDLYNIHKEKVNQADKAMTQQALMSVLADPTSPPEIVKKAIEDINSGKFTDSRRQYAMNAAAEIVPNESKIEADVRVHAAEIFDEINQYNQEKQAILNQHGSMLNSDTKSFMADFLETVVPFATNKVGYSILSEIAKELKLDTGKTSATLLPGNAIMAIREALANVPPQKQVEMTNKIKAILESNNGIFFTKDNDFEEYQLASAIFDQGGYSTFSKYLDNAVGLLDVIGLGGTVKAGIKALKRFKRTPEDMASNTARRAITDTTSPVAPVNTVKDVAPDKARAMMDVVEKSEGDEVAKALTGTTKIDAIASQTLPQPPSTNGAIESRVVAPNPEAVAASKGFGGYWLKESEKKAAFDNITQALKNAKGVVQHDNLSYGAQSGIRYEGKSVYGLEDGGFSNAEQAINQTKFSLAEFGITEKDITILKKVDGEYVPVDLSEVKGVEGDYLASVDIKRDIGVNDIGSFEHFDVKRNFFDRIPSLRSNKAGTVANSLLDNASMLSKRITGGAVVQADKGVMLDKIFLQEFDAFAKPFKSLPKARQDKMYDYLKLANRDGLEEDVLQLTARGFTTDEISTIGKWRQAWDTQWYFENRDLAKTLSAQRYQLLDHANAKLVAKSIQKDRNVTRVYDADLDKVVKISSDELDKLYDSGGTIAKLRRTEQLDGEWIDHIVVRNNPSNYLRAINETDEILQYRKGYYQIHYEAPKYIVQVVKDNSGNKLFEKAVDVAGDSKEAEHIRSSLANQTGEEFFVREDVKKFAPDTDYYWDLQSSSGRLAQKRRGAPLQDVTTARRLGDTYIVDPVEGAIRSARSLAGRVAMRDYLEQTKARALQQYGDVFPKNQFGEAMWTENSNSLVARGRMTEGNIRDARTTVEYLNYLQRGYENSFDEGFKGVMNALANRMANISSRGEKLFLSASNINPTDLGKNTVFQAYIATNPLRQLLVQAHQTVRLWGYNPGYMSKSAAMDSFNYWQGKLKQQIGGTLTKAEKEIIDFADSTGMLQAVDRHNLLRGALTDMAESHKPVKRFVGRGLAIPRKIGFDSGEQQNLLMHLLAVRDKFAKSGKNISDPAVRDEIQSVARAMSYDMNFAGDMPYNQNWASMILQFFQVPHKAITSVTTNRRIPVKDRMKLLATDILMFGIPGSALLSNVLGEDVLPENPEAREAIIFGLESAAINKVVSHYAGKEVNIDVSSLSPYNLDGWAQMADAFLTGGFYEMLANAPAANIFFKEDSKIQEAIGRMIRYGGYFDPERPEDVASIASGILEISSGWSNAIKAKYIWETGKVVTKDGSVMRDDAGKMEAIAKLLGFGTQDEAYTYYMRTKLREGSKEHEDEVKKWTKSYIRYLTRQDKLTNQDDEYVIKVLGAARNVWKDDYRAQEIINKELELMTGDVKSKLIMDMIRHSKLPEGRQSLDALRNSKMLKDEEYDKAVALIEEINKAKLED